MSRVQIKQEQRFYRIVTMDGKPYKDGGGNYVDNGGFLTQAAACTLIGTLNSQKRSS